MSQLVKDGHYRVGPKNLGRNLTTERGTFSQQFTIPVEVERQLPAKYVRRLPPPKTEDTARNAKEKETEEDLMDLELFGGFGGFGGVGP
jgi:hypothetical protein